MKNDVTVMTAKQAITFKNNELTKHMQAIDKAIALGKRSAFTIAEHVVTILDKEYWKDDFKNETAFVESLGYTSGMMSQWKGAIAYSKKDKRCKALGYTVNRAYMMYSLDKKGKLADFEKWCTENKVDVSSDAKLKDAITHFNGKLTKADKDKAINADSKEVKKAKAVNNTLEGAVKVVTIEYNGTVFSVPENDFMKFMKKYTKKS